MVSFSKLEVLLSCLPASNLGNVHGLHHNVSGEFEKKKVLHVRVQAG